MARSERFAKRGKHIEEMKLRSFVHTRVDILLERIRNEDGDYERTHGSCVQKFGDPASFGLTPCEGPHRFLRRYLNFHHPSDYSKYLIFGYPQLKAQIREGSTRREFGHIPVPSDLPVYITSGVAGALRMLCPAFVLPPTSSDATAHDKVIMPKLTYLSHSAEAAFAQANVNTCNITQNGQVDLDHLSSLIDENTRLVVFATVGNPLSTAMEPGLFDDIVRLVHENMVRYNHPITIIADVIYEHFRRRREERIDAIQRGLRLGMDVKDENGKILTPGIHVPIVETASFSKMLGMPGHRIGFYRVLWDKRTEFADERADTLDALATIYGTSLCPVPTILQVALGDFYMAINASSESAPNNSAPIEEKLVPVAAIITALKDLTDKKGSGDSVTLFKPEFGAEMVRQLGLDPDQWYTSSAIAKRTRKIANDVLGGYREDVKPGRVIEIGDILCSCSNPYLEKREIVISQELLDELLTKTIIQNGNANHKLTLGLQRAISQQNLEISDADARSIVDSQLAALTSCTAGCATEAGEVRALQDEFDLGNGAIKKDDEKVTLTFYKLIRDPPPVQRKEDGQLDLYGISAYAPKKPENRQWIALSNEIGLPTELEEYHKFKSVRRAEVFESNRRFATRLEEMRKKGLGVYLHPAYYDSNGQLSIERLNAFYVLWGLESLRDENSCQAERILGLCYANNLPLLITVPGEVFVPDSKNDSNAQFVRSSAIESSGSGRIDQSLEIIENLANILATSSHEEQLITVFENAIHDITTVYSDTEMTVAGRDELFGYIITLLRTADALAEKVVTKENSFQVRDQLSAATSNISGARSEKDIKLQLEMIQEALESTETAQKIITGSISESKIVEEPKQLRVLAMDDTQSIAITTKRLLEKHGYDAECAFHGGEAVDLVQKSVDDGMPFNFAILDLMESEGNIDGIEAAKRIHAISPETHLIVASGNKEGDAMIHPEKYGFCASIEKPSTWNDLNAVLERIQMKK